MTLQPDRSHNPVRDGLERTGLYHSFRLPDGRILEGAVSLRYLEGRVASFGLPEDLTGERVLDIGPWDGYFTFEMERRGAEVTAIDYVDLDTFRELHHAFHSKARYQRLDVYELDPARHGTFDIVLCLGVLYHLKHPLLALEKICAVTRGTCILETFIIEGAAWQNGQRPRYPYAEFYERAELAGQLDNWTGPTVGAVEAWIRAAGFAEAEVLAVSDETGRFAAHRRWRSLPSAETLPLELHGVSGHQNAGHSFVSSKEEYLVLWCQWTPAGAPPIEIVFPEIDGLGVAPLSVDRSGNGLQVQVRLPAGLTSGRHEVRIKVGTSDWSRPREFYVDLPPAGPVKLLSAQDGVSWKPNEADWAHGAWLTVWVEGLTLEADVGNTIVHVGDVPHHPETMIDCHRMITRLNDRA